MVALSAATIVPALSVEAFAQLTITCPVMFRVGNFVRCGNNGRVTIDPDGNVKSTVSCAYITNTPQPAVCTVRSGGITPVTKSVKVSFDSTAVMVKQGAESFLLDELKMSRAAAPTPVKTITLSTAAISTVGVTIKVGGRAHPVANSTLGVYTGDIVINANPL